MKALWGILLILLLAHSVSAATITGKVYDFSLKATEAIVEVNSSPSQKIVAKESYSFQVPLGNYKITAISKTGEDEVEETVEVKEQGTFVRDLILFPVIENDALDFEEPVEPADFEFGEESSDINILLMFVFMIIVIGIGYVFVNSGPNAPDLDPETRKVLAFISKKKRTTQKEIRKEFPHSEAKISLIITELEEKEHIKKIKKGRGNVIIRK